MGKTRTRTRSTSRKSTRKLGFAKKSTSSLQHQQQQDQEEVLLTSSSTSSNEEHFPKSEAIVFEAIDDDNDNDGEIIHDFDVSSDNSVTVISGCNSGCSTPKGQKFRIPEISTCPPAPKKRRLDNQASNCSVQRSPIVFFAPPDLELFFYHALRGISV